jgi:hypothetical protein
MAFDQTVIFFLVTRTYFGTGQNVQSAVMGVLKGWGYAG